MKLLKFPETDDLISELINVSLSYYCSYDFMGVDLYKNIGLASFS